MTSTAPGVPLHQPLYGAGFAASIGRYLRKYATFTGRASRSEFWFAMLFINLVTIVAMVPYLVTTVGQVVAAIDAGIRAGTGSTEPPVGVFGWVIASFAALLPLMVVSFALLVPTYAVGVRRLHDAGLSGWLVLLSPVTGGVFLYVAGFLPPKPEGLQYEPAGVVPVVPHGAGAPVPYGAPVPSQAMPPTAPAPGAVAQPFSVPAPDAGARWPSQPPAHG